MSIRQSHQNLCVLILKVTQFIKDYLEHKEQGKESKHHLEPNSETATVNIWVHSLFSKPIHTHTILAINILYLFIYF